MKKEQKSEHPERGDAEETALERDPGQQEIGSEATDEQGQGQPEETIEAVRSELERQRESMLRMQAEMENQRKRLEREADKSRRFALERVMKDLLQVRDSLERGLEVDEQAATVEGLRQGKALTLKMLSKVMEDHGLEVIDPVGEPFNPELHEAMTMAPSTEHRENTVIEVLQKGFRLHDRLIRPAMVVVSQKPSD